MSLKAKLEAVIYAADEPVTLAQLATLFADDVLAWKAEQEAALAEAQSYQESAEEAGDAPLLEGADPRAEDEVVADKEVTSDEAVPDQVAEPAADEVPESETAGQAAPEEEASAETLAEAPPTEAEAVENEEAVAGSSVQEGSVQEAAVAEETAPEEAQPEETPEAREKRLARQRDREVKAILRQQLDELIADYATDERGVEIREIAGGFRMATKPECHDAVRGFVKSLKPALKLSLPALETLAVIAYKQPVTAPEVNEIRGVDSSGVFGSLLARKLIATAGRKQVIGRPILYKTTKEFLLRFGLKDVNELPSMEEFEKMAASELEEAEEATNNQAAARRKDPELDENLSDEPTSARPETDGPETEGPETQGLETEGPEADEPQESTSAVMAEDSEHTTAEASNPEPQAAE